jgi:hypothetical protein
MNLEDKHIDELFRNAANQSAAPEYQSSYWKEMEGLLNDSKNRRKGLLFWSSIGGVMMIGLVSALLLSISSETKYNKVDLAFELELLDLSNLSPLNLSTASEYELSGNAGLISNKVIASKETIITKKGESHENNTSSVIEVLENQNKLLLEDNKSIKVEHLPLIPINLGFNTEGLGSENASQHIQATSFNSTNPFATSIELGGGVSQAYDNSKRHPTLFNASLKLDYKLNNFLFSTGLGVMVEQNTGITVSERAQVYGFGITNFEHSLNYKTLVDIAIPVQAAYQSGKNSFGLGAQLRYLANSSMRFESKQNGETMMAHNLSGLSTGLNQLNVDAFGFYERSLSNKLSLGLRITQQLTSRIASDKYFSNLDRTKTLNGQFYIKYSIFNH